MKSCKLIVLILFLIPVILPGFTVVEASESELLELLSSGPYITSWEAVDADSVLSGDPSILGTAPLELLVRWGSGLLIQADGDLSNIEIHEKFISSHNESFALVETVKVPEHQFIEPGKLIIPGHLSKERRFVLTHPAEELDIQVYTHINMSRLFYWEKLEKTALRELQTGKLIDSITEILADIEAEDNWRLSAMWVRMAMSAIQAAESQADQVSYIENAICDITAAFATLTGEETISTDLPLDNVVSFIEKDESDNTVAIDYDSLGKNAAMQVVGPAWIKGHLRVSLDNLSPRTLHDIPLNIRIDDVRTGHWPDGICRVISDDIDGNQDVSRPVYLMMYIPRGTHQISFDTEAECYFRGTVHQPRFNGGGSLDTPFPLRFFSLIPIDRQNDIGWLNRQFLMNGYNPLLQFLATHYGNRYRWTPVKPVSPVDKMGNWHLDVSSSNILFYLSNGDPVTIRVESREGQQGQARRIRFHDPDYQTGDPAIEIFVNNKKVAIPELEQPYSDKQAISISLFPGEYTLTVNSHTRPVYVNTPVVDQSSTTLTARTYYPQSWNPTFRVCGGDSSAPCRLFIRSDSEDEITLFLDKIPWQKIVLVEKETGNTERVEVNLPEGDYYLSCSSVARDTWLSVYQPGKYSAQTDISLTRDPFLESVINLTTDHPSFESCLDHLKTHDLSVEEKSLWLALAGDFLEARDMFILSYDKTLASHSLLLSWINANLGNDGTALTLFQPFIDDPSLPCSLPIMEQLLNASLNLGSPYRSLHLAESFDLRGLSSTLADQVVGHYQAGGDKKNALHLNQLAQSHSPRYLDITGFAEPEDYEPLVLNDFTLHYMLDASGNNSTAEKFVTYNVPKPCLLRLKLRSPVADFTPELFFSTILEIETPTDKYELPVRLHADNHQSDYWFYDEFRNLGNVQCGRPVEVIIPIHQAGDVRISSLKGCVAVNVQVQIPSLRDCIFPIQEQPGLLDQYSNLLKSLGNELSTPAVFAELHSLTEVESSFFPAESLFKLVDRSTSWKRLGGWPENGGDRTYLTSSEMTHDPIIEVRALDVPEPVEGSKSHLITRGKSLYFDTSDLGSGNVECVISTTTDTNCEIDIEVDRRVVSNLSRINNAISIPWHQGKGKRIRIHAKNIWGRHPIKLSMVHNARYGAAEVPLHGNRRYSLLKPGKGAISEKLTGRIIGPTCLKLELRSLGVDTEPQTVQIDAYTADGSTQFHKTISIPAIVDSTKHTHPGNDTVSIPVEVLIPLPEQRIHQLTVKPVYHNKAILVRPYAVIEKLSTNGAIPECLDFNLSPKKETGIESQVMDWVMLESPGKTSSSVYHKALADTDRWSAGFMDSTSLLNVKPGTWSFNLGYRDRDRDENDEDSEGVYAGDGFTGSVDYNRRFTSSSGSHRFYLEGRLAGTLPSDEPKEVIAQGQLTGTWHLGDNGYRARFYLASTGQDLDSGNEWKHKLQADLRRTFRFNNNWSWMVAAGVYVTEQTLDNTDLLELPYQPHPQVYTGFDHRHENGGYLVTQLTYRPVSNWMFYLRGRTISAGDGEDDPFGPWWLRSGFRSIIGPVVFGAFYEERQAFGDSLEPDRSRVGAHLDVYHWQSSNTFWQFSIRNRYTIDEEWNDFQFACTVRFNSGSLLFDFDPFRYLFKSRIESLSY